MYYDGDCTSLQKEDKSYYGSVQDFKENCNGFFIKASASGGSTSGVSSVAGKSGDVTLTKNDVEFFKPLLKNLILKNEIRIRKLR